MEEELAPGLLVSMPNLNDPYFQKSVILLCEYTKENAFGVVINRPSHIQVNELLTGEEGMDHVSSMSFLVGGPVQPEFLWGVHTPDFVGESTTKVDQTVDMSSVQEILMGLAEGLGPKRYHLGFGYAGWGPGQLDRELTEGAWWLAPLDTELILGMPYSKRWESVLQNIGIDPWTANFAATGEA